MAIETRTRAPRTSPLSVGVVGGGVVGLATAWSLARRGVRVTVIERDRCGGATSAGNAGWVTPGLSHPVPAPGVLLQSLRWMLDPESPFLIRPRLDPRLAEWGLLFARACRRANHRAGLEATYALARSATEAYDLMAADGVAFESHSDGLLYLVCDAGHLDDYARAYDEMARLGFDGRVQLLDRDELTRLEPSVGTAVRGGLLAGAERHVRPETVCSGLVDWLRDAGANVEEQAAVKALVPTGDGWSVRTGSGSMYFDHVVLAAGAWTTQLARSVGVRLPMEAAKGYSVTVPTAGEGPSRPLYLTEAKTAASPFDGALRLAGTLELAGLDLSVNRRRLEAVVRAAGRYVDGLRASATDSAWAGLRPMPADGLPVVGAVASRPGLSLATGHNLLGVTLAPATGEALARSIVDGHDGPELAGLSPDRFVRRRHRVERRRPASVAA